MSHHAGTHASLSLFAACTLAILFAAGPAPAREAPADPPAADTTLTVDGRIALHSLLALGDAHLQHTADVLELLASTGAARSGEWNRVREQLATGATRTVPAVHWFALPDGTYWTLEGGRESASLADRPYFPRVLDGETVVGELVVSRSSSRNTAIVAVPVHGSDDSVVGVLGSSVHLDSLSALVRKEMGGLDEGQFFFAIDDRPLGALHSDSTLIFTEPMELGDEGMRRAFTRILEGREGLVSYTFRGSPRTVLYQWSPVTGWWYGFGVVGE